MGEVTYTVTAQNKADPGERVTATVTDYNYTLYLSLGSWIISCSGVNDSGGQIIREKTPIELTVTQGVATPPVYLNWFYLRLRVPGVPEQSALTGQ